MMMRLGADEPLQFVPLDLEESVGDERSDASNIPKALSSLQKLNGLGSVVESGLTNNAEKNWRPNMDWERRSLFILTFTLCLDAQATDLARGVVFHDKNENETFEEGEPGVPQVCVSNGKEVGQSDKRGIWELPVA